MHLGLKRKTWIDVWKKHIFYLGRDSSEFNVTRGDNVGQGGKWQVLGERG